MEENYNGVISEIQTHVAREMQKKNGYPFFLVHKKLHVLMQEPL